MASEAVEQARAEVLSWPIDWPAAGRAYNQQTFEADVDAYAAAVRAEAIRERDEAIALLDKVTGLLEWALEYDEDDFGDRGFLHEEFPVEFREAVEEAAAARAFLSRFPEGGEA